MPINKDREERFFSMEIRIEGDEKKKIVGHAAVFNKLSEDLGGFREKIKPGTFKKTIREADIRALFNHNPDHILGRNKAGTLELREDKQGLLVEIDPPDTPWANGLMVSIDRGDIDQMSFGFRTIKDQWIQEEGKETIRELLEVKLYDVSPVTFPAYTQTDVAIRGYEQFKENKENEKILEKKRKITEINKKTLEIQEKMLTN